MMPKRSFDVFILAMFLGASLVENWDLNNSVDSNDDVTSAQVKKQQTGSRVINKSNSKTPNLKIMEHIGNKSEKFSVHSLLNYDRHEPPIKGSPTEVRLGVYINSFYSISEQTMDYSVSMYLRQFWLDPRLANKLANGTSLIRLGDSSWNAIWVPDTFFRNEKGATFHEVTVTNRLMRLHENGSLWYVIKISATLSCPMRLEKYPLDTQTCPMMFESFSHTEDQMYFTWLDHPVDVDGDLQLPQFSLVNHRLTDCTQNYTGGAFPCVKILFSLKRDFGFFLIQVYIPSVLIVILSWVSFWINVEASPARVSIGLLTVLTTTTMSGGARASLPRVSYIKAIDIWMIMCLLFVFLSLIEYAVVNVMSRRSSRTSSGVSTSAGASCSGATSVGATNPSATSASATRSCATNTSATSAGVAKASATISTSISVGATCIGGTCVNAPCTGATCADTACDGAPCATYSGATGDRMNNKRRTIARTKIEVSAVYDGKYKASHVDKLSRKVFPTSFVLFNVIYWMVYVDPFGIQEILPWK